MRSRRARAHNTPLLLKAAFDRRHEERESRQISARPNLGKEVDRRRDPRGPATGSCLSESVPLVSCPALRSTRVDPKPRLLRGVLRAQREHFQRGQIGVSREPSRACFMEGASHDTPLETKCSFMPPAGPINNPYGPHRTGRSARCGQVLSFDCAGISFCAASRFCLTHPQRHGILTSILRSESQSSLVNGTLPR